MRNFFQKKKRVENKQKEQEARTENNEGKHKHRALTREREETSTRDNKDVSSDGKVRDSEPTERQTLTRLPPPPLRNSHQYLSETETSKDSLSSESDSEEEPINEGDNSRKITPPRQRRYSSTSGESESSDESESSYESTAQFIRRDPPLSRPTPAMNLHHALQLQEQAFSRIVVDNNLPVISENSVRTAPNIFPTLADIITARVNLSPTELRDATSKRQDNTQAALNKHEKRSERSQNSGGKRRSLTKKIDDTGYQKKTSPKDVLAGEIPHLRSSSRKRRSLKNDKIDGNTDEISHSAVQEGRGHKDARLGDGCYLRYDVSNGGTIYAQWSVTGMAPQDALAYFEPKFSVSRKKYTTNEGRIDLQNGVNSDPRKYLEAWTYFWSMAREAKGYITTLDMVNQENLKLDLWTLDYEGNVNPVVLGKGINTSNVDCLAALPDSSQAFEDVDFVTKSFFINAAQRCGVNVSFER